MDCETCKAHEKDLAELEQKIAERIEAEKRAPTPAEKEKIAKEIEDLQTAREDIAIVYRAHKASHVSKL